MDNAICPECFQNAETMRLFPRWVRATIRMRQSAVLSLRLTSPQTGHAAMRNPMGAETREST